jgi:hypothetical protein
MLAIILVLDVSYFRLDRFTTTQAESWRFKGRWARDQMRGAEILVFGDSLLEFGVLPKVLQERTGLGTINLAIHNGSPVACYVLLRRALDSGAKPAAIVVDFMPHQLAKGPAEASFARSWPGLLSGRDLFDLATTMNDFDFLAGTAAAKALGCVAARFEIRACVMAFLRGEDMPTAQNVRFLRRQWRAEQGAHVTPETASRSAEHFTAPFPARWECDPTTVEYVHRFLDLAESSQIPVYWVIPPIWPGSQDWRDHRNLDPPYLAFIARLQAAHSGVTVIDGRRSGYKARLFVDAVHLKRVGAETLTAGIADLLFAGSPPGRRVALPPFAAPDAEGPGFEDPRKPQTAMGARRIAIK